MKAIQGSTKTFSLIPSSSEMRDQVVSKLEALLDQPVSNCCFRNQVLRLTWVGLQLLPQVSHIDAQVMVLVNMGWAPHLAQQLAMGQYTARVNVKDTLTKTWESLA